MGWIIKLVISLLGWWLGKKEEDPNVKLGRVETQKNAAEAELNRVDNAIGARDKQPTDYDSLFNDPANRSKNGSTKSGG